MAVSFSYADRKLLISNKRQIKQFIASVFKDEDELLESLNYVFCSDDFLLEINRKFLQHDYYTDIITFDMSNPGSKAISGEIYISTDRVKENAVLANVPYFTEMLRVIVHGALHLCGYKDKKKSEIQLMREREDHYLRLYTQLVK